MNLLPLMLALLAAPGEVGPEIVFEVRGLT